MKKVYLFLLLVAIVLPQAKSQMLEFGVYVFSQGSNTVVSDYPVWIKVTDSAGIIRSIRGYDTDSAGLATDSTYHPGQNGEIQFISFDCNKQIISLPITTSASMASVWDTLSIPCAETSLSCSADFTYTRNQSNPLEVSFQPSATTLGLNGTNLRYYWSFGDGNYSEQQYPVHTYTGPGDYEVQLTVSEYYPVDSIDFCVPRIKKRLWAGNLPSVSCQAGFTVTAHGDSIRIIDSSSFNPVVGGLNKTVVYDYGDGSRGSSLFHNYASPGTYNVCQYLTVYTNSGDTLCTSSFCDSVVSTSAVQCQTSYSWQQVSSGTISFSRSNTVIHAPSGAATVTRIDFGDGTNGIYTGSTINHTYPAGSYTACQTIYVIGTGQDTLCSNSFCDVVNVTTTPDTCHADYTYFQDSLPQNPMAYEFQENTYHSSGVPGYQIRYTWIIQTDTLDGNTVHYSFTSPGNYSVCLTIELIDSNSNVFCSSTECKLIRVSEGSEFCEAWYIVDTANSYNGEVYIWNMSTPTPADTSYTTSYSWDFGDGGASTQPFPTHIYGQQGMYNVCLSITSYNAFGDTCTSTYCDSLGVDANGQLIYNKRATGFILKVLDPNSIGIVENEVFEANVYPNPATDKIQVDFGTHLKADISYTLIDMQGKLMSSEDIFINNTEMELDVSDFSPGIYILTIKNDRSVSHYRIRIDN